MHKCDNPSCVNPAHLTLGTRGDNNADRSAKGRSGSRSYSENERARYSDMLRGEKHHGAKLTDQQARAIKYRADVGCVKLAREYGISLTVVKHIRSGRSWKHI